MNSDDSTLRLPNCPGPPIHVTTVSCSRHTRTNFEFTVFQNSNRIRYPRQRYIEEDGGILVPQDRQHDPQILNRHTSPE